MKRTLFVLILYYIMCYSMATYADTDKNQLSNVDFQTKRNPFMALVTPEGVLLKFESEKGGTELILEGIVYDARGESFALINGVMLKKGDAVGAYKIQDIQRQKVIVVNEDKILELSITEEDQKAK
jgi:hypothetical protein